MAKLIVFILLVFCQLTIAAENELPTQDAAADEDQAAEQLSPQAAQINTEDAGQIDAEEESSVRFIPTEEISQDLGVSFPVDI